MNETPLAKKLRRLIEANGPMSVADYMAHCLGDPKHGYYMTRDPFGARGDFITAPEVSQMFGEIIGAWLIEAWRLTGSPSAFRLVELGPGRGTLMADVLRVAAKAHDFLRAASIHLVETSPRLKAEQAKTLTTAGMEVIWHTSFADIPPGPLLLVANEFFDALPIRQFIRVADEWRERVIGIDAEGRLSLDVGMGTLGDLSAVPPPSLATGEGDHAEHGGGGGYRRRGRHAPPPPPAAVPLPRFAGEDRALAFELRPAADALMAEIAGRIVNNSGAALIIDYGYEGPAAGDTLQAVRAHEYENPLASPGEADLTAHVDFASLGRRARIEGAAVHGPVEQGRFLVELGLLERAGRLGANADQATREMLRLAVERLAGPDQMGTLFKTMAITRAGIELPPFRSAGETPSARLRRRAPRGSVPSPRLRGSRASPW